MFDTNDPVLVLASMFDEGWVSEVLYEVKSGKEATVYCCRGGDRTAEAMRCQEPLVAAKIHRDHRTRRFKNDGAYQAGRVQFARKNRVQRAIVNRSEFGREAHAAIWLEHEWSMTRMLAHAGLDVPMPLAVNGRAILMPFLGDETGPAPMLSEAAFSQNEAKRIVDRVLRNVRDMLDLHCVHGDLSPYNILYWKGKMTIIDFPQAVDPRMNPAARSLLERDVENICKWGAKLGDRRDPHAISRTLWRRFRNGELG